VNALKKFYIVGVYTYHKRDEHFIEYRFDKIGEALKFIELSVSQGYTCRIHDEDEEE